MVNLATSNKLDISGSESFNVGFTDDNAFRDVQFKLAHNLQSTLDIRTALELFFNNIQDLVALDGLEFVNGEQNINITIGNKEAHQSHYNISVAQKKLGSLSYFRKIRFGESELAALEMLIGVLFYPLRNALLYHEALQSSMRDKLTGIGNRYALELCFSREIKLANRHKSPLSLLIVDIDHFKKVNDTLGHRNGDRTLQQVVNSIQHSLRETDQIFRYGGEEFVALLNNTDSENAWLTAERIRTKIATTPIELDREEILISVSIGVSSLTINDSEDQFFERADKALYKAKNNGRNKVVFETTVLN